MVYRCLEDCKGSNSYVAYAPSPDAIPPPVRIQVCLRVFILLVATGQRRPTHLYLAQMVVSILR